MPVSKNILSSELRAVEQEIDRYYRKNPLLKLPFAEACWYLLAHVEDHFYKLAIERDRLSLYEIDSVIDQTLSNLRYPLFWLFSTCPPGGKVPFRYDDKRYQDSQDLLRLGEKYLDFTVAFTYASRGIVGLTLQDNQLYPTRRLHKDNPYEAYNRLVKVYFESDFEPEEDEDLINQLFDSLKIDHERFHYKMLPKSYQRMTKVLQPIFDVLTLIPDDWQFSRYRVGEFKQVFQSVYAIAMMHYLARTLAAKRGCLYMGYVDSLIITSYDALARRVVRYTGLDEVLVNNILSDLIYGSNGIKFPDPMIQPLIRLNQRDFAIVPNLWLGSNAERNFTVLANKLPQERELYARLSNEKERLMKEKLKSAFAHLDVRFSEGKIPARRDLPDLDLAVIDDRLKLCLLLELKWFIEPAEAQEVIEKSQELTKGVGQLLKFKQFEKENVRPLMDRLHIDESYRVCLAVVSVNWIGNVDVQHDEVVIIAEKHLCKKLAISNDLATLVKWLESRAFLPIEGVHYNTIEITSKVGPWSLSWYGFKPLISELFLPL